jgi:hypothetical protein
MVPVAPIITGITAAFTFHMCWIYIIRSLYFKISLAPFLITFLSPWIATSINMHVTCFSSRIMMSDLLLRIVLSVRTCWFYNMVTLTSRLVSTDFGTWSYQSLLSNSIPISFHMLKCSWAHTPPCLFMYCSFANTWHGCMCSTFSTDCVQSLQSDMVCSTLSSIVYRVCSCYLFLLVIFLSHDILFAMPDTILLLFFHFQSLISHLPSTAIGTYLLRQYF